MNKKNKIAIIAVVIIIFCGIIYSCSSKTEYDDFGNVIEVTSIEEITEESTTIYEYTTEETTEIIRPTETTTEANDILKPVYIPDNTPDAIVDHYIMYDGKRLAVNFSIDSFKAAIGNPIKFIEETTETTTNNASENETEFEPTTAENTDLAQNKNESKANQGEYYNSYRYREFILYTKLEKNKEIVKNIEVISDKVNNLSGFSPINKPLYEITLAYGEPTYTDMSICKYTIDSKSYLYFKTSNGVVATWGIAANQ